MFPQVSVIYSSPSQLAVQTADRIAEAQGLGAIRVEPGLAPALDGPWYDSWLDPAQPDDPRGELPAEGMCFI